MADDFDVEAMLEAPFRRGDEVNGRTADTNANKENRTSSSGGSKKKHRSRSRSREKVRRSRSRSKGKSSRGTRKSPSPRRPSSKHGGTSSRRSREKDPERKRHRPNEPVTVADPSARIAANLRSRDRRRPSRERRRSRSKSPRREHRLGKPRRSRTRSPLRRRSRSRSPLRRSQTEELTPEERDQRTVFCMQLSQRVRIRDLEEFFSSVGKVKDVRLIMDNKTRRSKGICYVEFASTDSVPLALGLNNQKLLGIPIIVQPTQAEKNRAAASATTLQKGNVGPMRLYVGSLHFNITEDMLRGIFEPFGKIDNIELTRDLESGRSKGYGFITFHDSEDAKKALEQLNGFELAGRPMKVGHVTERSDTAQGPSFLDSDELDRSGIDLGATGRLQLMAKLAEGTGFQLPQAAVTALQMTPGGLPGQQNAAPPIATQCFMLANMFDPAGESNPTWDEEIRNDVIEECRKHGGAFHVFVDRASPQGNVYVKCPTIAAAVASVNALHGRWFAGRVITAAYVPVINYHSLFPDALTALNPL